MNKDLEETLSELGPGYRAVVDRLRAGAEAASPVSPVPVRRFAPRIVRAAGAGLLAAACLAVAFRFGPGSRREAAVSRIARSEYMMAYSGDVETLIRTQRADGSWANDFLTRQNAAALRGAKGADVAYRRAVRYLRARGLAPLSDGELRDRIDFAARAAAHG